VEQTRGHAAQPEAIGEGEQHLDGGVLLLGLVGHFGRDRDPQLRCAWPFCGCGQVFCHGRSSLVVRGLLGLWARCEPAAPGAGRCRPQRQNKPAQITGTVLQAATAKDAPAQEPGQLARIHPRCRLSPIVTKAQIEQEPVGYLNFRVAAIDHRPIGLTVRQDNPKRPELAEGPDRLRTLEHASDGMTSARLRRARHTLKRDSQEQIRDC